MEEAGAGIDTVNSALSFVLGENFENLTLTGYLAVNATGNASSNVLTGNLSQNVLDGGAGADVMIGGSDHNTYVVDNAEDVVIERYNEGRDAVRSSVR